MTLPNTNITIDTPKKKAIALGVLLLVFLVGFAFGKAEVRASRTCTAV